MSAKPRRHAPRAATPPATARPRTSRAATSATASAAPALPVPVDSPSPTKRKPVRDSFTMPPADHALIAQVKERALRLEHPVKKSEVLRAGLKALAAMDDFALRAVLQAVPPLKTGRPKKDDGAGAGETQVPGKKGSKKGKAQREDEQPARKSADKPKKARRS